MKILLISLVLLNCISFVGAQPSITSENSELIIEYRGNADSIYFDAKGGEKIRLLKTKENLWLISKPINDIDQLILQYRFIIFQNDQKKVGDYTLWVNEKSENFFSKKQRLSGSLFNYSFERKKNPLNLSST